MIKIEDIKSFVKGQEIDVTELNSYRVVAKDHFGNDEHDYDYDEEWEAKKEQAIEQIKADTVYQYFDIKQEPKTDEEIEKLNNYVIDCIEGL